MCGRRAERMGGRVDGETLMHPGRYDGRSKMGLPRHREARQHGTGAPIHRENHQRGPMDRRKKGVERRIF